MRFNKNTKLKNMLFIAGSILVTVGLVTSIQGFDNISSFFTGGGLGFVLSSIFL